jgi:hypothetical protein
MRNAWHRSVPIPESLVKGADRRGAELVADLLRSHDSFAALRAALVQLERQSADAERVNTRAAADARSLRNYTDASIPGSVQ